MKNLMKAALVLGITGFTSLNAQHNAFAEQSPNLSEQSQNGYNSRALWDIEFNHDVTTAAAGDVGMAGAVYFNNEFWVSRWASDTIYRINMAGAVVSEFTIAGLSGTRSFTTDGTYIYAGTAATTIYRINPATQTLAPPHITVAAGTARFCTYDSTLNAGAGGFWIGNFNTDIYGVSMTGALLTTIPVATHGLSGMYGAAVDNYSVGGPFLWIFHQGGASNCELSQLALPSGIQTGLSHDVMSDVGAAQSLSSGLAGGCFLSNQIVPGEITIGGLIQGTPSNVLFGYELSTPSSDAAVTGIRPVQGYTQIPLAQVVADSFQIDIANNSGFSLDTVYVNLTVEFASSVVHSEQLQIANMPGGTATVYSSAFLPANGVGNYLVKVDVSTAVSQPDLTPVNDTMSFTFTVTDTVYARDNGIPDGGSGYAISSGDWGYAVSLFTLHNPDTIGGVWIELATPVDNDTTFGIMVSTTGGVPTGTVNATPIQIISSSQNVYYMEFPGGLPLAAGVYGFGCYEGVGTTINLAQSSSIYTPGTNFFYTGGTAAWTASGIATARFIHPVMYTAPSTAGVEDLYESNVTVYPNPSQGVFNIGNVETQGAYYHIYDINGKVVRTGNFVDSNTSVNISSLDNGTYLLRLSKDGKSLGSTTIIKN